jgi:hypothetical protein
MFWYLFQVGGMDDLNAKNSDFHFSRQRVDSLGSFNFMAEVIVEPNGGHCHGFM